MFCTMQYAGLLQVEIGFGVSTNEGCVNTEICFSFRISLFHKLSVHIHAIVISGSGVPKWSCFFETLHTCISGKACCHQIESKNVDGAMHFIYTYKYNTNSPEHTFDMN